MYTFDYTPDVIDETILRMIMQHASVSEMAQMVGRSTGGIVLRLDKLRKAGYVSGPPRPGMARSYRVTQKGHTYMQDHGYVTGEMLS